jgi:CheY-like chemotaxis protein
MEQEKLLLADNKPNELRRWAGVLETAGYQVTPASNVAAAQDLLLKGGFDLAVLDLHLVKDDDDDDLSGLLLARTFREKLPIILLTGRPTSDSTIEALRKDGRSAPAVAVVRKGKDGPEGLLKAVREAIVPKVFVSHGHDTAAAASVVKFLEESGAHAIVLGEELAASQTILDAFEKHANVQFAVILMTSDDEGRKKGEKSWQPRARQNVVLELGFFLAKLGRDRVTVFCNEKQKLEWPSNFNGAHYRELDSGGGWQLKLARDMHAVGIKLEVVY